MGLMRACMCHAMCGVYGDDRIVYWEHAYGMLCMVGDDLVGRLDGDGDSEVGVGIWSKVLRFMSCFEVWIDYHAHHAYRVQGISRSG